MKFLVQFDRFTFCRLHFLLDPLASLNFLFQFVLDLKLIFKSDVEDIPLLVGLHLEFVVLFREVEHLPLYAGHEVLEAT